MTDDALFETRKRQEIIDLRVRAGTALADAAMPYLNEAERRLKLGGVDNYREADDNITRARVAIEQKERQG